MKAKEKKFLHFLEGSDKHFLIPVYQRNYDWKKEHCSQLFNDLIDLTKSKRTHFLGSIVSIYHDDGDDREYLIIDGQQRLTTISLLLLAIYKLIDENKVVTEISKEQIRDEYLINKYSTDDKKIRLKPVKNDKNAFASLFKSEDEYMHETNITVNFLYFYTRIQQEEISIDELFLAIKQIVIVEIELKNGEDDPQLIFESLNSTGLDLTEADKVRNFVLMQENSTVQEQYYNDYWNKIEVNTNYAVSNFIRDYLTMKDHVIPNKDKVYQYFKVYVTANVSDNEDLLKDLLKYSKHYERIINSNKLTDKISIELSKINRLESIVTYPFLMEIFEDYNEDIINEDELIKILQIIISFVFRRLICDVPTNALNKIFMVLGREIKKYEDYEDKYLEIFKRVITQKKSSQRFPDNDEFKSKIITKDIYNFKSKNKLFLLEQLENFDNKERVDIENLVSTDELTIEHIMPQTLTPIWKKSLGENFDTVHNDYLHTIGNITLTAYNSKYSNKPFTEKCNMEKGFKESRLFLNKLVASFEEWNEANIIERADSLRTKSLKIWAYPISNYEFAVDDLKVFTLADDEINFTGEKILSFKVTEGNDINVSNWKDFFRKMLKILFALDPIKFKQMVEANHYICTGNTIRDAVKIADLFVYSNLSVEAILTRLRILTNGVNIDLDEVRFVIE